MTDETATKRFTLESIPGYTVPALLLGVPALIAILALIAPETFYDNFVEKYYWGPIRDDTGYNPVNTATWAILMGLCILGLTQMMQGLKVTFNATVIYGAVAWVVAGSLFRVLEDTSMFAPPLQYVMITPPIYLLFAVFGVLSLLVGIYIEKVAEANGNDAAMTKLWFIQAILVLVYTVMWAGEWDQILIYLNPIHVAVFAVIGHLVARWWVGRTGTVDGRHFVTILAVPALLMGLDYVIQFLSDPWSRSSAGIPDSFVTAALMAGAVTAVVASAARSVHGNAPAWPIAAFGFLFAAVLGYAVWTGPELTAIPFDAASILSIVALAGIATGLGYLFRFLMQERADWLFYIGLGVIVLGAFIAVTAVAGRFIDGPMRLLIGAAVPLGYLLSKRKEAGEFAAQLKENGGVSEVFTNAFTNPVNLLLIGAQSMDGFGTSLGLDLAGYSEKHVLSGALIESFAAFSADIGWTFGAQYPTFIAFVPVKLAVSMLVVYAIDVYSKDDVAKYPTLIGFVKFAIIMVGIGPAVRNVVRLSLGV